ncbi:MAG: CUAEP/CCAEP-tail radical SAM protein [Actinomycetota bacterium]|nr:CUAEP/CCAEP-tail radical SAM protein [Actinomycetota bacterium]
MRVLLVSTYELGHQPLHVASPAARLRRDGHDVRCLDLSVERWDADAVAWAEAVGFSVPMHTAMRLAMRAAGELRRVRPELPVCLYGLYAPMSRDLTVGRLADRVIAGEYEPAFAAWVNGLAAGEPAGARALEPAIELGRAPFELPARDLLPPLERYAHLAVDGEERPVGYVEATHGCRHRCRHCPVPVVYDGLIRAVGRYVVLADVERLVAMGARHVTFGDPDFLNAPTHSLRLVRAMHERFPELTFDCTTKVEHILRHAVLWPELAASGCLFVVSAFEAVNDAILERLAKGHTTAEAAQAIAVLREHGIEPRPSLLPFTPWTTLGDVVALLEFVAEHDLVANVDPVQYTIRLLLPEGSLLLDHHDLGAGLGPYDAEALSYPWASPDPMVDLLQARLAALVEERTAAGEPIGETYAAVRAATFEVAGREDTAAGDPGLIPAGSTEGRPRLTEPWFC